MKPGWEIKRLKDEVEFLRGLTYSKKDEVEFSDNIVLRSNNIDLFKNELDFTELKYINPAIDIRESKKVKKGSLLICTANGSKSHLGKVALIDDDYNYAFGGFMGQISPKDKLDSKFLFYLMTSDNYKKFINELSDGANINNLNFTYLGQFEIPLPPLPEQQRIVSILDEAFSAIDRAKSYAERNLKNAKEIFESYLKGVFENGGNVWDEKTLEEACEFRNGAAHEKYISENGKYILVNSKFISAEGEKIKRTNNALSPLYVNDITFVMSDVPNGKALAKCFLIEENDKYTLNQRICAIKSKMLVPHFLFYQLNRNKYLLSFNNGENQTNLRKGDILKCPILVPSIEEQQTIVRQLDALKAETQKLEALYQKKLDDLEELKKSILQKAFSGELTKEDTAI